MYNKLLSSFYNLIKSIFVKDIDVNKDFVCSQFSTPILTRTLFCTEMCSSQFEYEQKIQENIDYLNVSKLHNFYIIREL